MWHGDQAKALRLGGNARKALELLREGVEKFPDNPQLLTSCAVEEGGCKNLEAARQLFSRAVELEQGNPIALRVCASCP